MRQADRLGDAAQIALHERYAGALYGDVSARPHRDAHVCLRERRRIVDAVARHRDHAPRSLKRLDLFHLLLGKDFGHHFVDAELPADCLGSPARIAREHDDAYAPRLQRFDGLGCRFLDRVGHRDHRRHASVDRGEHRRLALCPERIGLVGKRWRQAAETLHESAAADCNPAAGDDALHALPGDRLEVLYGLQGDFAILSAFHNRLGQWMLACALEARDEAQRVGFRDARLDGEVDELRSPEGQRAGLVDDQRVDLAQLLHGFRVAEQNPVERALTHRHGNRDRRREADRARTGDDQHRDGVDHCIGKRRLGTEESPHERRDDRDHDHRFHEIGSHQIGKPLYRCARSLRLRHHVDDPGQERVRAHALGADDERAFAVDRRAGDPIAGLFRHRNRLARDHGLIDVRGALEANAVDRHSFARAHAQAVADLHRVERHFYLAAVGLDA